MPGGRQNGRDANGLGRADRRRADRTDQTNTSVVFDYRGHMCDGAISVVSDRQTVGHNHASRGAADRAHFFVYGHQSARCARCKVGHRTGMRIELSRLRQRPVAPFAIAVLVIGQTAANARVRCLRSSTKRSETNFLQ